MTDSQGKLIWKGRYDAWGHLIHDSNRHAQRSTHQPFRLQNPYFDQETGLHYNFLRYYELTLGRFITQDPIGLMGGRNLYRFEGTVQNQVDPLGLFAPALAVPWLLEGLAYVGTAITGILIGVGAMEAAEEEDKVEAQAEADGTVKYNKTKCPPCNPPAGVKFDFQTHTTHDHGGCLGSTGSKVHWHYSVNNQRPYPDCTCFTIKHAFGGCGPAPIP